jgi:hypothetical protein
MQAVSQIFAGGFQSSVRIRLHPGNAGAAVKTLHRPLVAVRLYGLPESAEASPSVSPGLAVTFS